MLDQKIDDRDFWIPAAATGVERLKLRLLHHYAELMHYAGQLTCDRPRDTCAILTYHRIALESADCETPTINVTPHNFRRQLIGLIRKGFRFVSLSELLAAREQPSETNERRVAVTFDDIFDNVYQNAWPVLQELNIPATVFISTAFVDSIAPFPFDRWGRNNVGLAPESAWRPIQQVHLEAMLADPLITLGAHTHSHRDFRHRPMDFATDLQTNVERLSRHFGIHELPFAFPYGVPQLDFCHAGLMRSVQDSGLTCALTTGPHTNRVSNTPYGWGRFHVFDHDSPQSLSAKLNGWYEWLPRLRNAVRATLRSTSVPAVAKVTT
jgi:peptidoglycan/xylan/chitin deacetylase (PgdA/CDA1 family)